MKIEIVEIQCLDRWCYERSESDIETEISRTIADFIHDGYELKNIQYVENICESNIKRFIENPHAHYDHHNKVFKKPYYKLIFIGKIS